MNDSSRPFVAPTNAPGARRVTPDWMDRLCCAAVVAAGVLPASINRPARTRLRAALSILDLHQVSDQRSDRATYDSVSGCHSMHSLAWLKEEVHALPVPAASGLRKRDHLSRKLRRNMAAWAAGRRLFAKAALAMQVANRHRGAGLDASSMGAMIDSLPSLSQQLSNVEH